MRVAGRSFISEDITNGCCDEIDRNWEGDRNWEDGTSGCFCSGREKELGKGRDDGSLEIDIVAGGRGWG